MKTIEQYFNKKIPAIRGQVITIGCTDAILDKINENDGIHTCYTLNNVSRITGKYKSKGRLKNVNIKKFKRKFKKKRTDVMIVDALEILDFTKRFVPSSVYITKGTVYIYGEEKTDSLEKMIQKYDRYCVEVSSVSCSNGIIYKIDCKNTKPSRFKDFGYLVKDTWNDCIDLLGDYLIG